MKTKQNGTWVGAKDLSQDPEFMEHAHKEFNEHLPIVDSFGDNRSLEVGASRRDFLKYLGFGLGAATVAASCEIPLKRAIPYVVKPDTIVPGVANYYASSIVQGGDYCSVLVKTREGRPIKIEGNDLSGVTKGGTSARSQAYVLSLYDTNRFRGPQKKNNGRWQPTSWDEIDNAVAGLNSNAQVRIVSNTILSPTAKKVIGEFAAKYPNTRLVTYDPVSSAALLKANEQCFGLKTVPDYHFDKAKTVVGIQADFLGTWISPVEYAKGYIENRKIRDAHHPEMSRHIQVETYMSLTGSNADNRVQVSPSQVGAAVKHLYNAVASRTGGAPVSSGQLTGEISQALDKTAEALVAARGESLVVCGTNNLGEQILVNGINHLLGNYGTTITFDEHSRLRQGDESDVSGLLNEMENGRVDALFVMGANPVFELPN
ncbi:MAG: TAT-variant-translocated molybdopterin oxidoreductase, partial [Saprospiraceae bacterium]|nr:TAT-variant-translocated molybdopterin oxidoreductase [Saprospiraceae bacterium]